MRISGLRLRSCHLIALLVLVSVLAAGAPQQSQAKDAGAPKSAQQAVVNQYCVTCHNDKLKTGGLSLNGVNIESVDQNRDCLLYTSPSPRD